MKPYYEQDGITIYHGDCMEVMPNLHDVGLVLTSPPYNLDMTGYNAEWDRLATGYDIHSDSMPHDEYVAWQQRVTRACWDALADDGALFYNHKPMIGGTRPVRLPLELVGSLPVRQIVIWDRGSGFNRNPTHFVPVSEWVLIVAKARFRITTRSMDDVWRVPFETGNEHPAPFPLSLARRAVAATAAGVVVDPFMGSGTTLRAALDCNRKAIGIELSERYCEIAANRLAQGVLNLEAQ